jgi:hypothetical protein
MLEVPHGFNEFLGAILSSFILALDLTGHQVLLEAGIRAEVFVGYWVRLRIDVCHTE